MPPAKVWQNYFRHEKVIFICELLTGVSPFCKLCGKGEKFGLFFSPVTESHFPAPALGPIDNVCHRVL